MVWVRDFRDETLDEMLRGEGRGSPDLCAKCAGCQKLDPLFRCARQTCLGPGMYCEDCIVGMHRQLPTHMVEMWTGEFFIPMPLNELTVEARVQLGHLPGTYCPRATPAHKDFVILDTLGIRTVKLNFCGCDSTITHRQQLMRACLWPATSLDPQTCATFNAIRLFEVQNCLGKISAYDFVRSLELLSNNDGLKPTPDRRRAFRTIVRQYRMSEMRKRAGTAHFDGGCKSTKQGSLALLCRQCPQPGMNLIEGWDKIDWDSMDEDQRYKYFLWLAEDANFKLINRQVSTEDRDPIIDDGSGYFCHRGEYSKHIRKHVDEEEISSCSGFQAMFLANTRRVKGLRVTGIGGVTCARHNMWRPNGLGDLQAGERYCNMEFLFFSAVLNFAMMYLILSYDIACQFSKHLWERMSELPEKYQLKIDRSCVRWMVPNFHLPGHKKACHSAFSFHWLWGAGRNHGEGVEQNWEFLNGAAGSTKLMGLGARFAALEGLFAFHNWRRQIAHFLILKRRMAEAIKGGKLHKDAFDAFHAGLSERMPELVEEWRAWVEKYEREAHVENEKNVPYEYEETNTTLKQVRLKLAQEEYARTGDGTEVEREDTPSTFISMGMEIEETQRQLAVAIKAAGADPSTTNQLDFLKRRTLLRVRIDGFRRLQLTYMPKLRRYMTASQRAIWDAGDREPEATRLFMPSDLGTTAARDKACARGLDGVEARLREAEAAEALDQLRQGLRTRTATTIFKVRNWSGQRALTRGQGILRQINIKIHAAKLRYRYARQAILKLKGHGEWEKRLQVLMDDDVRGLSERSLTEEERAERNQLVAAGGVPEEGGTSAMGNVIRGESHRTLSWIWYSVSDKEGDDEKLHEALRVEWCKAYSRSRRWREELVTLEEEMGRTLAFGEYSEQLWIARASARENMLGTTAPITPEVAEGARAYALEQADRERRTNAKLEVEWGPIRRRGAEYLRGEDIAGRPDIVIPVDSDALRWAEATVYERDEVENDIYQ
ncbi:hypothetical protein B0H15DRAFT_794725 [Mycena belliarum]|uniref:CxC2-like cysteine cluster KDZ transposase-associated domain-containing protein n=1 Tax=Mycena belliarum TaxID=1033014 RepID=A0AAD6TK36_9AGAR|nr:hypothetical protein B0H15DRAFT_794725 [Mycena belliae]